MLKGNHTLSSRMIIFSLFLVLFIDGLGVSVTLPLFPDMFLSKSTSMLPAESTEYIRNIFYGITLVSFPLGMFFGAPVLGELSDKFGRKRILMIALGGTVLGYIISGISIYLGFPKLLIFGRVLDGLTAGSIPIAQAAIVDVSKKEEKTGNFGLILFAVTSGYFFGPFFSEFLTKTMDQSLATPFYATALLSLISMLFLMPLKEPVSWNKKKDINWGASLNTLKGIIKIKPALPFIIALLFFQLGWTMYFQYLPYLLPKLQHQYVADMFAVVGLGMVISFCLLTRFFQKVLTPTQGSSFSSIVLVVSVMGQLLYVDAPSVLFSLAFVGALGYGLGYSFLLTQMSGKVSSDLQGLIMGFSASMSALSSVATALLGIFFTNINNQMIFIFSIFCFSVCSTVICVNALCKISVSPFALRRRGSDE